MPLRQRFVVQLAITEVQWNQRLLVFESLCLTGGRTNSAVFAAKKRHFAGPSISTVVPAK